MIIEKKHFEQILKYLIIGTLNTLFGYILFALLLKVKIFYLLSLLISHIIGTINSYVFNKKFTFKSKDKINGEIQKFFLVYTLMFIANFLLLYLAVDIFKIKPLIAQIPILFLTVVISFIGQRFFTFRKSLQTIK